MSSHNKILPMLYSFRRCPYAIRARYALALLGVSVDITEVKLSNKPPALLALSPKGTVPVLQLSSGLVIDESLDIMCWAHEHSKSSTFFENDHDLILLNDHRFKQALDLYKYFERDLSKTQKEHRDTACEFIKKVESQLSHTSFLTGEMVTLVDIAIMPFVRQFSKVDEKWFYHSSFKNTQKWLDYFLNDSIFKKIMQKNAS